MYSMSTKSNLDFSQTIEKVTALLKEEGFGILSDIDVQKALKEKINVERPAYRILGACNPKLANQAINEEPEIGVLLPCNVVVREDEKGQVIVSFMNPASVLGLVNNNKVGELGEQVLTMLKRVSEKI